MKTTSRFLATLGVPDYEFLVLHIPASELENLAYPHATPGHEFQHEAVSYFGGPEDDLADIKISCLCAG